MPGVIIHPSDIEIPEAEFLEKKDELIAKYRRKSDFLLLQEAIGEATGEQANIIDRVLESGDSMMLGQALTVVLFDYIRVLVKNDMEPWINRRKAEIAEEEETRLRRVGSGY